MINDKLNQEETQIIEGLVLPIVQLSNTLLSFTDCVLESYMYPNGLNMSAGALLRENGLLEKKHINECTDIGHPIVFHLIVLREYILKLKATQINSSVTNFLSCPSGKLHSKITQILTLINKTLSGEDKFNIRDGIYRKHFQHYQKDFTTIQELHARFLTLTEIAANCLKEGLLYQSFQSDVLYFLNDLGLFHKELIMKSVALNDYLAFKAITLESDDRASIERLIFDKSGSFDKFLEDRKNLLGISNRRIFPRN
ncbi:hypothetical protein KAFR_0A04560 [Kazachstania africana CBS 2517]|uniref:Uncharacterized protein n=1 Tax=Kazachstania africana (strain ATCC 22294 / BCRC 22015 / CBS 2517 / CECT 1963 / NBRC 1671 / NRRL Y-8276) TaxID=1071382 RepID=H2ANE1_KAZAF|nr:hypothetical protein KAFR_0A04560 [Kazachstania africana CBS 2517]CCF55891.1 hypothetical protein KAFR_0A04560 [Kazachstania africana CBS 2517]